MEPQNGRCSGPSGMGFSPPGGSFFVPRGVRNGLTEASWGFLGARSASGGHFGRLWAEKGESTNCMDGSWGHLGALLAALGPVLGRLSHPREEAWGVSGKSFLEFFFRGNAESPPNSQILKFFSILCAWFFVMFCPLLPCSLRARRRCEHAQILNFQLFLWVGSYVRLFRGNEQTNKIIEHPSQHTSRKCIRKRT